MEKQKQEMKNLLVELNKETDFNQDDAVEVVEDILLELKTQDFMLPSLKKHIEEEGL